VFLVNLPLGIAAVAGALRLMPEARAPHARSLDWAGAALVSAAMGAIVFPLIQGREAGWPAWTFAMMAAGAALLAGFGLQQRSRSRRGRDPLVELSLLRNRSYTAGLAVMQVFFAGISGLG